jgi:hypothetical protein
MGWEIEYTDEFEGWWEGLDAKEQASVSASVDLLGFFGPGLRYPHSSDIKGSGPACGSTLSCALCV